MAGFASQAALRSPKWGDHGPESGSPTLTAETVEVSTKGIKNVVGWLKQVIVQMDMVFFSSSQTNTITILLFMLFVYFVHNVYVIVVCHIDVRFEAMMCRLLNNHKTSLRLSISKQKSKQNVCVFV